MDYANNNGPRRISKARALRKNQTPAEKELWGKLRNRNLDGFKFRRQQIIDEKIVDFFCAERNPKTFNQNPLTNPPSPISGEGRGEVSPSAISGEGRGEVHFFLTLPELLDFASTSGSP